jgi:hypothetical protein
MQMPCGAFLVAGGFAACRGMSSQAVGNNAPPEAPAAEDSKFMEVTSASNRVSTSAYASLKSVLSARTVSR